MKHSSGPLSLNLNAQLNPTPQVRLLLEMEPRSRVFFRNLTDLLRFRSGPPVESSSPPGDFWNDVFVYSGVPWWSFVESTVWHMLAIIAVLGVTPGWVPQNELSARKSFRESYVVYYPPSLSFPAMASARPRERAQTKGAAGPARQTAKIGRA